MSETQAEKLNRLTERIWVYPFEEERDRPNLGYIRGDRWSLAVDAGHSDAHVAEFYRALEDAGLKECDVAVVAIGANVEASLLATANCKELGVGTVIAKATSELHGKILEKLGADQVIFPDRESAHRLARSITNRGAFDLLEISEGYSIAEIKVPEVCRDKTLAQADLRKRTGVTVLCIRRLDENPKKPRAIIVPGPNDQIHADDKLIVFGTTKQIDAVTGES